MSAKPTIDVTFTTGDTIDEAFAGAIQLATRTDAIVKFDFNGVTCVAMAGGRVERGVQGYHNSLKVDKVLIAWA